MGVLARAQIIKATGAPFSVRGPTDVNKAAYAARMQLGPRLDELEVQHNIGSAPSGGLGSLLEARRVDTAADGRHLAGVVTGRLTGPELAPVATALWEGITELCENVEKHSGSFGFIAAQTYKGEARFAVADAGIGLKAKLSPQGATDDLTALHLALNGISSLDEADQGHGLRSTADLVGAMGGHLRIATGDRSLTASSSGREARDLPFTYVGTILQGVVPLPKASR